MSMKIDHEYCCVWAEEQQALTKRGIRYTFVKTVDGVTTWKYRKDEKLFLALAEFYQNVYSR